MDKIENIIHHCLYFTGNALARVITKMAERRFLPTGLSPSHAYLMLLVLDEPGVGQKDLCEKLQLAPSTVTRFIDTLVHRGLLKRKTSGKASSVFPTDAGVALQESIQAAWHGLHEDYAAVLGLEEGDALAAAIDRAVEKLGKSIGP